MRLEALDSARVDAYVSRLGVSQVRQDLAGLTALQVAHLMAVPFHNLLLLAGDGEPTGLPPLFEVVDQAIAGVGGTCDRTTPAFAALLQSLGFDVYLAAATVREPGDHFTCVVRVDGRRLLCDVGNGHPYLRPWDLDGPVQEQSFHGWRFRFEPRAEGGPTLIRQLGEGVFKTVYVLDPTPRRYEDFEGIVRGHYTRAGFGPFLSSLRAVRIQPDVVLTLRDRDYGRDTRFGRSLRKVAGGEAFHALLVERFGLPSKLVERGLATLTRRRPELGVAEPRWLALGRGCVEESRQLERPDRSEVPDVLVSLATIGRSESVRRLLRTLAEERRLSGYPGHVGVLLVENCEPGTRQLPSDFPGISLHCVPVSVAKPALDRAARALVLPPCAGPLPLPIGAAREAQIAAIHAHLQDPVPGLPHPAQHPTVVWMVDDDVAFEQLGEDGQIRRRTNLLFRAARLWSTLPQHAVVLGTFTGDPPIPGLDGLGGQLRDLSANLAAMVGDTWRPPPSPSPSFDAYYDLSESTVSAVEIWPYAPTLAGRPIREVALRLLRDLPRLLDGQQLTRPLVWDGRESMPKPSLRRGGNTLFLDFDALFRWPTPSCACADGVLTRRADTLWAALARAEDPLAVVEATLPLLHGREGQAPGGGGAKPAMAGAQTAAQVRGVVLARALAEGRPVARELAARETRVKAQRQGLRRRIAELRSALELSGLPRDAELDAALAEGLRALDTLDQLIQASEPITGDSADLQAFLDQLPHAVRAWRGGW